MTVVHQLIGYGKKSQLMEREVDVPEAWLGFLMDVAGVDKSEDPRAVAAYPIAERDLPHLAAYLTGMSDVENFDWFLEAFETAAAG